MLQTKANSKKNIIKQYIHSNDINSNIKFKMYIDDDSSQTTSCVLSSYNPNSHELLLDNDIAKHKNAVSHSFQTQQSTRWRNRLSNNNNDRISPRDLYSHEFAHENSSIYDMVAAAEKKEYECQTFSKRVKKQVLRQFNEKSKIEHQTADCCYMDTSDISAFDSSINMSSFYDFNVSPNQKRRLTLCATFPNLNSGQTSLFNISAHESSGEYAGDRHTKSKKYANIEKLVAKTQQYKKQCSLCINHLVLLPENKVRQMWDFVVFILLAYTIVILPLRVAFSNEGETDPLDIAVDVLFLLDIMISFVTAYKLPDGRLVVEVPLIVKQYLRTWFIFDAIATFPFYMLGASTIHRLAPFIRIPRLLKMFRLVRLIKLLRAYRLKKFFDKLEFSPKIHQGFVRIAKLLIVSICFAHCSACLWLFIGEIGESDEGLSWISDTSSLYGGIMDEPQYTQYIASLYFSISALATVGFGDITPQNNMEMAYSIVVMLLGATVFSYITATMSSVMHDFDQKATIYRTKMANIVRFVKSADLSPNLTRRMIAEMSRIWRNDMISVEDTGNLREELPRQLLFELSLEMHAELVNTSSFFRLLEADASCFQFIGEIVSEMRPKTAFEGEFIANVGEHVNFWAIIKTGSVIAINALDTSLELMMWNTGDSLGEVGIFLTKQWPWSMRCIDDTTYFIVNTEIFLAMIAQHRNVSRILITLAGQRVDRMMNAKKKIKKIQKRQMLINQATFSSSIIIRKKSQRKVLQCSPTKIVNNNSHTIGVQRLHYRFQKLMNMEKDQLKRSRSEYTQNIFNQSNRNGGENTLFNMEKYIANVRKEIANDSDRQTARGRWRLLKRYVLGIAAHVEHDMHSGHACASAQLPMQGIQDKIAQVKKYQFALDEIQTEMKIWKQGMSFTSATNLNYLKYS